MAGAGGTGVPASIWWIRRDLRLRDNAALAAAMHAASCVIPLYILDPALLGSARVSTLRVSFLMDGLRSLDLALRRRGSYLVVRSGDPAVVVRGLVRQTGALRVFAEAAHSPYARARDARVADAAPLELVDGVTARPPGSIVRSDGAPYVVFTPFSRAWLALPLPELDDVLPAPPSIFTPPGIFAEPIPAATVANPAFPAGEDAALERLSRFVGGDDAPIYAYERRRDRPHDGGTSGLSPYLRFGMLSAREAMATCVGARQASSDPAGRRSAHVWLNELLWREFFHHVLHHFPGVETDSFRADLRDLQWRTDREGLAAWREGRTGYPFVDAAMRQLAATGWIHNRARMVTASFLAKDLLVDWREGEAHFMRHLIDGDLASNNGGWQWVAGTGTDAAPYFRVFNPSTQAAVHDPGGSFVRAWLPELARVPDAFVHSPWEMPAAVQHASGCLIGRDDPEPIVDHAEARGRALAAYREARLRPGAP